MAFVGGQLSITLNNNNDVLADFYPFFSPYILPHTSVALSDCISIVLSVFNILTHLTTVLLRSYVSLSLRGKTARQQRLHSPHVIQIIISI